MNSTRLPHPGFVWMVCSLLLGVIGVTGWSQTTAPATHETPATHPATTQPITTAKSPVGDLLRKWWAEGTAAGNVGDMYDNRDRTHSELNRVPYPQLGKIQYSREQLDTRRDWAAQHTLIRGIVFGNSSTSAPILNGGSNPRMYYTNPRGVAFLANQYILSNLYIYPEHQDHDPGHNGTPGYGDVYPTNTPYLIISQGSSGSDQPFMRAVPFTLAAFRPEVKRELAKRGMLMPTIQMILRSSMKNLKTPEDYLTGKAHPTVFEGANVDDLKMVQMAHAITLDTLPPMVAIKVEEEDRFANGKDFFDVQGTTEMHADTPFSVSRIWRATAGKRRIVVAAAANDGAKVQSIHWSILRGDPKRITIKPLDEAKSKAEITIEYHQRMPIAPGAALESNRVDIGVFVSNGTHWSPPAFLTFMGIDSEARTYDKDGRLLEIGYGNGTVHFAVSDWIALFDALAAEKSVPGIELIKKQFTAAQLEEIAKLGLSYKARTVTRDPKLRELLDNKQGNLPGPIKGMVESAVARIVDSPRFLEEHAPLLNEMLAKADPARQRLVTAARARLVTLGLAKDAPALKPDWARDSALPATRFESAQLARYQGDVAALLLFPALLRAEYKVNYVDPAIARPRFWRDVHHYDPAGKHIGWTRYGLDKVYDFAPDGQVILEKDSTGAVTKSAPVRYDQEAPKTPARGPNWTPLRQVIREQ